jgi:hypothetical protein
MFLVVMTALALVGLGAWLALGAIARPIKVSRFARMTPLMLALTFSVSALADVTSGPINSLPKANIVQDNGSVNAKGFSTDPQIANCVANATGVTATTTSLTVLADATNMTCTTRQGALISNSTDGTIALTRSGLYRVRIGCNGTGTNGNTMTNEASVSNDDGATWAQVSGANAIAVALTADLSKNMSAGGYVSVTSGQAAAGTTLIAQRAKNSANTTTCISGEILSVERVAQLIPAVYP